MASVFSWVAYPSCQQPTCCQSSEGDEHCPIQESLTSRSCLILSLSTSTLLREEVLVFLHQLANAVTRMTSQLARNVQPDCPKIYYSFSLSKTLFCMLFTSLLWHRKDPWRIKTFSLTQEGSFVRYCGQRPSLLWTSALRPCVQCACPGRIAELVGVCDVCVQRAGKAG